VVILKNGLKSIIPGVYPSCYTYSRRPLVLKYTEIYHLVYDAIAREKQIKGWSRKKKEALINENYDELKRLSKNRMSNNEDAIVP
jgi:putative endonuclease